MKIVLIFLIMLLNQHPNRILHVYCSSQNDPVFIKQMALFKTDPNGLREREIVIKQHFYADKFSIQLVGKDGSEKFRDTHMITLDKLYAIIDGMPMRREEMTRKKNN